MRGRLVALVVLGTLGLAAAAASDDVARFLERHWRAPLTPQGPPPARFSALEASLQPESCGACHPVQFGD